MLGELFGVTGVMSALLEMESPAVVRYASVLNNSLDVERLRMFKQELNYLLDFLERRVAVEYDAPQIRRLSRQISLIEANNVEALKRSYKYDISLMSEAEKRQKVEEINAEVEILAREIGAERSVVNNFKRYDGSGRITLGEYELAVLTNFKEYYQPILKRYVRLITLNSFKEVTVFGEKLHRIATLGPGFILGRVERMFSAPGANNKALAEQCLESVELIRLHYPGQENATAININTFDIDGYLDALDYREYLASLQGLNYDVLSVVELPESIQRMGDLFDDESKDFLDIVRKLSKSGAIQKQGVEDLVDLYFKLFRLDHDYEWLCAQLFPEGSGIVLDKEELEALFSNLNEIGFYMFHMSNSRLMVDSLKKLSFSSESRTTIDPELSRSNNLTFRKAIDLVEVLCLDIANTA